jgi:hypothetical protein
MRMQNLKKEIYIRIKEDKVMADMDKIKVDELQDVTGGMVNADVGSGTELDSTDIEVKRSSPVFCYPALSILVKLVDRYYRKKNS